MTDVHPEDDAALLRMALDDMQAENARLKGALNSVRMSGENSARNRSGPHGDVTIAWSAYGDVLAALQPEAPAAEGE